MYQRGGFTVGDLFAVRLGYTGGTVEAATHSPAFFGDIYSQWAFLELGLNPANLGATRGLRTQVR